MTNGLRSGALWALRLLFLGMSLYMIYVATATSLESNLFKEFGRLMSEPWMKATLVDFYFNIAIISAWTVYKENCLVKSGLWIAAFVLLGSIATAFYVFLQLMKVKPGDDISQALLRRS